MPRPRSTLFPYTTLFRSIRQEKMEYEERLLPQNYSMTKIDLLFKFPIHFWRNYRSEERFSRNAETEIYTLSLHDALPIYPTGKDGIRGASFASKLLDDEDRSAVQIPDPSLEKL